MTKLAAESLSDLLVQVGQGDREAFALLYDASAPRLFGLCLRLMRGHDRAQDVLQDAYIRIWQKAHLFDPKRGTAMTWLITVTRRCALDRLRQHDLTSGAEPLDAAETPDLAGADAFSAPDYDLRRCLSELQVREREVITLAFVYGMSHSELSSSVALPLGTIKSRIRRGLRQLKECVQR